MLSLLEILLLDTPVTLGFIFLIPRSLLCVFLPRWAVSILGTPRTLTRYHGWFPAQERFSATLGTSNVPVQRRCPEPQGCVAVPLPAAQSRTWARESTCVPTDPNRQPLGPQITEEERTSFERQVTCPEAEGAQHEPRPTCLSCQALFTGLAASLSLPGTCKGYSRINTVPRG